MARKTWVWSPDSGGVKIPEVVKRRTEARIRRYAEEHFAGKYTRLEIRFRGQFCYIDACATSAMRSDGALLSTPTATKSTSCPSSHRATSEARRRRLSTLLRGPT
jgi:hypothetical protein